MCVLTRAHEQPKEKHPHIAAIAKKTHNGEGGCRPSASFRPTTHTAHTRHRDTPSANAREIARLLLHQHRSTMQRLISCSLSAVMCTATIPEAMPDGALHTDGDGGEVKCVLGHWIEDHHPHRCLFARIPSVCSQSPAPWPSQAHTLPHLRARLQRTRSTNLSHVWPNEVPRNKTKVGFLFKQDNCVLAACSGVRIFLPDSASARIAKGSLGSPSSASLSYQGVNVQRAALTCRDSGDSFFKLYAK